MLAETLDRVSRDQADVATLYKHLQFARGPLVTLAEGEISELHVGLKGTMNALFLKDLAKKTHRGRRGWVEKGSPLEPSACPNNRTIWSAARSRASLIGRYQPTRSRRQSPPTPRINRENREQRIQADADRRRLARVERAVAGIMAAIEDGLYQPAMKARIAELEREKAGITARLAEAPADVPDVHPGIAEIYKRKVARLIETLKDPETRLDASSDIRSLVCKIVLHPGAKRGEVHATLHGSLIGILDFANDNLHPEANPVIISVAPGSPG